MSILNSTKSGKCIVPLTIHYLTEKHWRFKAPNRVATIDYDIIWKNKEHYLKIKRDGFRQVMYLYLEFETQKYIYRFTVKTVADLDLVEEFWKKSKTSISKEAIDVLKQNEENLKIEKNSLWDYSDYSEVINKKICSYIEYSDKDFNTDQPWKSKNSKNYFSSYFK